MYINRYTVLTIFKRYSDACTTVVTNDNDGENSLIDLYRCIGPGSEGSALLKTFMQTGYFTSPKNKWFGKSEIFLL